MRKLTALAAAFMVSSVSAQSTIGICLERGTEPASFDSIRFKSPLSKGIEELTLPMLADTARATEEEKSAIAAWAQIYSDCKKADPNFTARMRPDVAALFDAADGQIIAFAARLYAGEITWGEFNTQRQQLILRLKTVLTEMQQRERVLAQDRARALNDAENQAHRNAAMQYLLSLPSSAPQPPRVGRTTNCYRFGKQLTCHSW